MANRELPDHPDDVGPPEHPPVGTTDASRPAAHGRHDIVEDADGGVFWPEVDDLLTIDFSTELASLPQAGDYLMGIGKDGWDPSLIPLPPEMANGSSGAAPVADPMNDTAAVPVAEQPPVPPAPPAKTIVAEMAAPQAQSPMAPPAETIVAEAAVPQPPPAPPGEADGARTVSEPPLAPTEAGVAETVGPDTVVADLGAGRATTGATAFGDAASTGGGIDPLLAPVPVSTPQDFDFFREATGNQVPGAGRNFGSDVGSAIDPFLANSPRPEGHFRPTTSAKTDVVRDLIDRRLFTTVLATAVAGVLGLAGWVAIGAAGDGNRSEAVLASTTVTSAAAGTTIDPTADPAPTILPPTTFALTTSTVTNTTLPPTKPRPSRPPRTTAPTTAAPTTQPPTTRPGTTATTRPATTASTAASTTGSTTTTAPTTTTTAKPTTTTAAPTTTQAPTTTEKPAGP